MRFGTLINCIDGRVQYPVMDYLKKNYNIDFFDAANEITYIGLYVNERWEVKESIKIEP